jgi:hypothetical protein
VWGIQRFSNFETQLLKSRKSRGHVISLLPSIFSQAASRSLVQKAAMTDIIILARAPVLTWKVDYRLVGLAS